MRLWRGSLSAAERERRSALVTSSLLDLGELCQAGMVFAFASFGSEVGTDGLLAELERRGVSLALPFVDGSEMAAGTYRLGDELVATSYGPLEPATRRVVDPSDIEAVVVPGLAFDRQGERLGSGQGYYDRYLAGLAPAVPLVGIGFSEQLVEAVPVAPGDIALDLVVTDAEVLRCDGQPSR
jgi:5-formyltetrahydrofolate cyclo-ligase